MKYDVLREHFGDRFYRRGEQREAQASSVTHLVRAGVLAEAEDRKAAEKPSGKAAPKPQNKAAPAGQNKAAP